MEWRKSTESEKREKEREKQRKNNDEFKWMANDLELDFFFPLSLWSQQVDHQILNNRK